MSEFKEIAAEERKAKYAEAAELCRGSFVKEKVAAAREMFIALGDHRDSANWSECSLRRWLNKDFMEKCFTLPERMDILLTPVRNDTEERWRVENGPNTRDKAFVFNWPELEGYFPTKEGRACGQWYWLRGFGWSMLSPMAIYTDGTLYEYGVNKNSEEVGVRPAMWVRKKIL